jgi:hypothetical protein
MLFLMLNNLKHSFHSNCQSYLWCGFVFTKLLITVYEHYFLIYIKSMACLSENIINCNFCLVHPPEHVSVHPPKRHTFMRGKRATKIRGGLPPSNSSYLNKSNGNNFLATFHNKASLL